MALKTQAVVREETDIAERLCELCLCYLWKKRKVTSPGFGIQFAYGEEGVRTKK